MSKKLKLLNEFEPLVKILPWGDINDKKLIITFDSNFICDQNRSVQVTVVDKKFFESNPQCIIKKKEFNNTEGNTECSYDLVLEPRSETNGTKSIINVASMQFHIPAIEYSKKEQKYQYIEEDVVEATIREKTMDIFSEAMDNYLICQQMPIQELKAFPFQSESNRSVIYSNLEEGKKIKNSLKWYHWLGMGMAAILLISFLTPKKSPIDTAVYNAMQQDPASVESQVELTKKTLKEMGLDVNNSGSDLGCLTE